MTREPQKTTVVSLSFSLVFNELNVAFHVKWRLALKNMRYGNTTVKLTRDRFRYRQMPMKDQCEVSLWPINGLKTFYLKHLYNYSFLVFIQTTRLVLNKTQHIMLFCFSLLVLKTTVFLDNGLIFFVFIKKLSYWIQFDLIKKCCIFLHAL